MSEIHDGRWGRRIREIASNYSSIRSQVIEFGDEPATLAEVVRLCDEAPDDDHLDVLAVLVLDPLLDSHWPSIRETFGKSIVKSAALRRAFSSTMPDIPPSDLDRLNTLIMECAVRSLPG